MGRAGDASEIEALSRCERREDRLKALADLFTRHRDRLRGMVQLRLDPRLKARIDPSDVIQDAFLEASRRLDDYLKALPMPPFLWLRRLTAERLLALHRRHLGTVARDARREVHIDVGGAPAATSAAITDHLLRTDSTPSDEAMRAETRARVQEALESMYPMDREVLVLRHFEQLTNSQVSRILELDESAASKRYFRALERLRKILGPDLGGLGGRSR